MTAKIEHAWRLAKAGFAVFPCRPNSKVPATTNGYLDASRDPGQIEAWWADRPDANIGIWPASPKAAEPMMVVDVDVKPGKDGRAAALELEGKGLLPPTWTVDTPSGGWHLYYKLENGQEPPSNKALADGLDIRSGGGYVLAPGSTIDGKSYTVAGGKWNVAPALKGLVEQCHERRRKADNASEMLGQIDEPTMVDRAIKYVSEINPPLIGERNGTVFRVAAHIREHMGISYETCIALIKKYLVGRMDMPLDMDEVERTIESAYINALNPGGAGAEVRRELMARAAEGNTQVERPFRRISTSKLKPYDGAPLVRGLLNRKSVAILSASPGSFKTFLALDLCCHVANGEDWAGCAIPEAGHVVYVAGEGQEGVEKRLRAWRAFGGREHAHFDVIPSMPLFDDDDQVVAFEQELLLDPRPDLIVIDTLSRLAAGMEENSARDMSLLMAWAERVKRHGPTVLFIHHTAKGGHGPRGSGALLGAADTLLSLHREGDTAILTVDKNKDLPTMAEVQFVGHVVDLGVDSRGERVDSLALSKGEKAPRESTVVQSLMTQTRLTDILLEENEVFSTAQLADRYCELHCPDEIRADEAALLKAKKNIKDLLGVWARRGHGFAETYLLDTNPNKWGAIKGEHHEPA